MSKGTIMKSASLCPRAPIMKNNQATVESGKAFLRPTRNDIIISCIHAHAYMHTVREGEEKKDTFFPDMMYYAAAPT